VQQRDKKPAGFSRRLFKLFDVGKWLEYAQHDRADKGKGEVRGHHAQLTDERTKGHRVLQRSDVPKVASKSRKLNRSTTQKLATGFMTKKSALLSVHRTAATQHRSQRG
jgi:hypothetical protein